MTLPAGFEVIEKAPAGGLPPGFRLSAPRLDPGLGATMSGNISAPSQPLRQVPQLSQAPDRNVLQEAAGALKRAYANFALKGNEGELRQQTMREARLIPQAKKLAVERGVPQSKFSQFLPEVIDSDKKKRETDLTKGALIGIAPGALAALAAAPATTLAGVGAFTALDHVIKPEKYLPEDASDQLRTAVGFADFIAKGAAEGGLMKAAPKLVEKYARQRIIQKGIPRKISVSREQVRAFFGRGEAPTKETTAILKDLGLTRKQRLEAVNKGINEIRTEDLVKIADKPGFARFKRALGIDKAAKRFPNDPLLKALTPGDVTLPGGFSVVKVPKPAAGLPAPKDAGKRITATPKGVRPESVVPQTPLALPGPKTAPTGGALVEAAKPPKGNITPSGQVRLELQPPIQKDLFQEKGELFENVPPKPSAEKPPKGFEVLASKPAPDAGLIAEAKKYKTAEEFVKSVRAGKWYHGGDKGLSEITEGYATKSYSEAKKYADQYENGQVYEIDPAGVKPATERDFPSSVVYDINLLGVIDKARATPSVSADALTSIWNQAHGKAGAAPTTEMKKTLQSKVVSKAIKQKFPKPAASPQDFAQRIDQLNKFAQTYAIPRRGARLGKTKLGDFTIGGKEKGRVRITEEALKNPRVYMSVLAHELGHALEFHVVGRTNAARFSLFGDLDDKTMHELRKELVDVTHALVGEETAKSDPEYYYKPAELLARYFEKMLSAPGDLEEMAPSAARLLELQAIKHPIIQEFLTAARLGIDKNAPKFVLFRDLRETYQKHLGYRVGNMAYDEEIAYRAMKERAKAVVSKFVEGKFKGIKDDPETLFRAAESIRVTIDGKPQFGTRDFVTAHNAAEEKSLAELGYSKMPEPVVEDGKAYPQYAKTRYSPEEGKKLFDALSPQGKQLVKDFTAERQAAKDYFNREVIKDVHGIESQLEGWVHHYFKDRPQSTVRGGRKFKTVTAGSRRQRTGTEGYVEDFKKAMTKAMVDLEGEKAFNDFIKRQFARVTRPIAKGENPLPGWVEVQGNLRSGVGLPQEKRARVIDKATGESVPMSQTRYQMPQEIYERYKMWRGLIQEASTAVRVVNDINRYWRVNILAHPGTAMTNHISGGVQYSMKILTDFYKEVLTGQAAMPQTRRNLSAMIKVLMPKGWADAPDWIYGGDISNFYGQFANQPTAVSAAIDTYANGALKLFGTVERYWKKVIITAEDARRLESLGQIGKEGLRLPTAEERDMIAAINKETDLYALDYDNVAPYLEQHQRSAMGQAIKPFAKYPYKYMKTVMHFAGAAFNRSLPWQERVAKLLALATIVGVYANYSASRKKKQRTPVADKNLEIPARVQTRGRLFIKTDEKGRELFARVAKYPYINLTEAGMQFVDGNWETGKDTLSEMIGSIGPMGNMGMLALNYRNKYQTWETVPSILGENLATFTPGYRILSDVSQMLDPFKRKQRTFAQEFTRLIPTTDPELQEKFHGEKRTVRVPIEGKVASPDFPSKKNKRTTIDVELESQWQDVMLSMLTGIYIHRVDPEVAEAYLIREEKNYKKREAKKNQ